MKVGYFTGRALPTLGGAELVVDSLSREVLNLGCEPVVIAPRKKWWHLPNDSGLPYRVYRYPPHLSKRHFVSSYLRYLRKAIEEASIDILHVHEVWPHAYLAACLRKQGLVMPMILTSHGSDAMLNNRRYRNQKILDKARWAIGSMDAVIANSPTMKTNIIEMTSQVQPIEISNGVHFSRYSLERQIDDSGELLFIGRLTKRKGVDVLLEAVSQLPIQSYRCLHIAGWGRERASLERLARRLQLNSKVIFHGAVDSNKKQQLLSRASLVIIPTLDWEACSLVALESFASGTPIVASDVQGISHFFERNHLGSLVPPGNPKLLAEEIQKLLLNPARRIEIGQRARKFARNLDWKYIAMSHIKLYQHLLSSEQS